MAAPGVVGHRPQDELLALARKYHRRGLPLATVVYDFFHWTRMGDWAFAPDNLFRP